LWDRRSGAIQVAAAQIYKSSYALGEKVSPHLATTRPLRYALIHVSQRARDARIADPRALWVEFFAPILGAFEALKEDHVPVATINDLQLEHGTAPETRVVILPHESECSDEQRAVLRKFESAGGAVLRLDKNQGWHSKAEKQRLKRELLGKIAAGAKTPPIRARGPAAMHAVFFQSRASDKKTVVCLVNSFGWFRSEREASATEGKAAAPPPCCSVALEIADPGQTVTRVFEALTGKGLDVGRDQEKATVIVPSFPVMACVVVERR
jgi:hypothetical protein